MKTINTTAPKKPQKVVILDDGNGQMMPPIFVISLKKDVDKRVSISQELDKFGLKFEFIDAVDGASLDDETIKKVYSEDEAIIKYRPLVKGEIGCAMSHISVWQKMLDEDIDEAIIFEDDAIILDNFIEVVQNLKNATPKKWQLILFSYNAKKSSKKACQVSVSSHNKSINFKLKRPLTFAYQTHAYLLNKSGARHLIQQTLHLDKPIDNYTGDYKIVDVYCVNPPCAGLNYKFGSAIEDEREQLRLASIKPKLQGAFYTNLKILRKYRFIAKIADLKNTIYHGFFNSCIRRVLVYKFQHIFDK